MKNHDKVFFGVIPSNDLTVLCYSIEKPSLTELQELLLSLGCKIVLTILFYSSSSLILLSLYSLIQPVSCNGDSTLH